MLSQKKFGAECPMPRRWRVILDLHLLGHGIGGKLGFEFKYSNI